MSKEQIHIVGDHTNKLPYMIVKLIFGNNNYVGHKVLKRFKTYNQAKKNLVTV